MYDSSCVFCRIAAREIPSEILHDTDRVVGFRDSNPKAPTHILLMPVRHITSIAEAEAGDGDLIGALHMAAAQLAQTEKLTRGYRLVINTGPDGGQTVDHLHLHLLGGRPMRWPPG